LIAFEMRFIAKVLSRYPTVFQPTHLEAVSNLGGFSGAFLFRIEAAGHPFALRAWPAQQPDPARLGFIHRLMKDARLAGLDFVPQVIAAADGSSFVEHGSRLWDLTQWLSGRADYHDSPTPTRLESACTALARLHAAWEKHTTTEPNTCPAIARRLAAAADWREIRHSGWQLRLDSNALDPVRTIAERAWHQLDRRIADVPQVLQTWMNCRWRLQACHCDPWHDNLLFVGDELSGLIDYGAAKIDQPAVDVARMLGSLAADDASAWQTGLQAYRKVRPFSDEEVELAIALDKTGTIIGAATWLRWLYEEKRTFEDRAAVAGRLSLLVERMENWKTLEAGG
jgi:homoserine kinase type II